MALIAVWSFVIRGCSLGRGSNLRATSWQNPRVAGRERCSEYAAETSKLPRVARSHVVLLVCGAVALCSSGSRAQPVNDDCADAIVIGDGTFEFSNIGANSDGPATCAEMGSDLWFTVEQNCAGSVSISTCTPARTFDTALGVLWGETDGTFEAWSRNLSPQKGRGYDLEAWTQSSLQPNFGPVSEEPTYFRLAMTNGDPNAASPKLTVLQYDGPRNFDVFQKIAAFPSRGVTSGDFSGDGLIDLAAASLSLTLVRWFEQQTDLTFTAQDFVTVGANAHGIDAGLLSKIDSNPPQIDNLVDLAVAAEDIGRTITVEVNVDLSLTQFRCGTVANSSNPADIPTPRQILVVDIDGDGLPDILITNQGVPGAADASEGFTVLFNRLGLNP